MPLLLNFNALFHAPDPIVCNNYQPHNSVLTRYYCLCFYYF